MGDRDNHNQEKPDQLRGHDYDGIEEYDNQLPRWWVYKFLLCIVFAIFYLYFFHIDGSRKSLRDQFLEEKQASEEHLKANQAPDVKEPSEEELRALLKKPEVVAKGKALFAVRCASCHGEQGQGIIGPNLTDDYWLHGNKMTEIVHTITYGVPEKGMIAWKDMLTPEEIRSAAVFVKSIHGNKVNNPKKPEGNLIPEN